MTKHSLHVTFIGFAYQADMRKAAFLLNRLLSQNMTLESVFTLNFTGAGEKKSLLGAGN